MTVGLIAITVLYMPCHHVIIELVALPTPSHVRSALKYSSYNSRLDSC